VGTQGLVLLRRVRRFPDWHGYRAVGDPLFPGQEESTKRSRTFFPNRGKDRFWYLSRTCKAPVPSLPFRPVVCDRDLPLKCV
jgi:hypothetical protein